MKFTGLTDKEVLKSREKEGANVIPDSEPATFWDEFKETFNDPMIRILLAIVVIMLVMFFLGHAEIYEPIGTVIAVLIVAFVTAKTAVASDTKYRELKGSTKKETCKVYRNGIITVIEVDDVVVGDKIILQAGDKIPADGILIDGDLRVDNSVLNGEAEECKKFAAAVETEFPEKLTGETFVDDYSLFRGAVVFDGEGILDVRKVGIKTMMGKMAEDMQDEEPDSPLKVKLSKLAKQISIFGYASAVIIVILYMAYFIIKAGGFSGYVATGWSNILMNTIEAVSLAILIVVCAVPEGLPLMISLVLMQNTSKMLDHNVLVRKAVGVETAGSLNILFSDKTGTITKGSLEVVEFFTPDGVSIPLDEMKKHGKVKSLVDIAIGKNTASMFDGQHKVIGGNASIASILNSMTNFRVNQLEDKGIECLFISALPFEYKKNSIMDISYEKDRDTLCKADEMENVDCVEFDTKANARSTISFYEYESEINRFVSKIEKIIGYEHYGKLLVLGTEECMYPAIRLGEILKKDGVAEAVKVHATTRSPIIASCEDGYPLNHRYQIRSVYNKERDTYVYNLKKYDKVIVVTDTGIVAEGMNDLLVALRSVGNKNILVSRWSYF